MSEVPQFTKLDPLKLTPPLNITVIRDEVGLEKLKDFFQRCDKIIGWDIETDPRKDYFWRRCRTIQFGNQTEQYVIDLLAFCDGDPDLLFKAQGYYGLNLPQKLKALMSTLELILCSKEYLKVGVNLSFEYMSFYWLFGLRAWNFWDCAMVEKCIWAGAHSMKDYSYYSMEEMMQRYFRVDIDKELQMSFTLDCVLTDAQIAYAALDTRFPLPLRQVQNLILQGVTYQTLKAKGSSAAKYLQHIDPIVTGDNLDEVASIENDAIGAFQDMHIHGERLDRERWLKRIAEKKIELKKVIKDKLDPIFIPIVGSKNENITDEQINKAEETWKAYNVIPEIELEQKAQWRASKKDPLELIAFEELYTVEFEGKRLLKTEVARKIEKEKLKAICSELKKKRTAIKNLVEKCEGEALINYGSGAQLLKILTGMKGLKSMDDTEDETLEKLSHIPVIAALRDYRGLSKEIGTYGEQWATEWKTKPCKDEGWLHPGDGRLHCIFNQYDAETGRSTSEKPNGQNLPQDKEVRGCFIADPPNENIRISNCCQSECGYIDDPVANKEGHICHKCFCWPCETHAEEYVIVTADMSGAELRIIAELANDPIWIEAFGRGEDVHSVGTELLYGEKWSPLQFNGQEIKDKKTGEMKPYWCEYYKLHDEKTVAKNPKGTIGQPMRQKCECPEHKELRDGNKSTNFLLAYGGGPHTLAARLKKKLDEAKELMALHAAKFPKIWQYLDFSGQMAKLKKKSFDMFGRRRLFPDPTWERAKEKAKEDREEKLEYPKDEQEKNVANFVALHKRKPTKDEMWLLKHRLPTSKEIANAFKAMHSTIERQGKNHAIQGTNASIAKKAMGSGFCPAGKPYLWHTLPQYKARLIKFVHDELVVQCPKRFANDVAALIGDAFRRAAAEKMKKVVMEFDFNIATYWKK